MKRARARHHHATIAASRRRQSWSSIRKGTSLKVGVIQAMWLVGLPQGSISQDPSPSTQSLWIELEMSGYRAPAEATAFKNLLATASSCGTSAIAEQPSP